MPSYVFFIETTQQEGIAEFPTLLAAKQNAWGIAQTHNSRVRVTDNMDYFNDHYVSPTDEYPR